MAKKKAHKKTARQKVAKPKSKTDFLTEVIREVAGEDVLPLVKALRKKKNVSEFKLADAIKKEINLTRNMLYRLYDHHLVTFIRKKDKKKGWYIYYWTFNPKRVKELAWNLKKNKIEKLKERLAREQSTKFFACANKCIRLDFDQATEFEYKCPECGEMLQQEDNTKLIADLQNEINKLEKELKPK
ncbi:MAG: transcription factor [Candidatus Woesearchaeota archaeon]